MATTGDSNRAVGLRVREMRKWLRLSQGAVAEYLNLQRSAISSIENGKRSLAVSELLQICRLFHCEPNVLLKQNTETKDLSLLPSFHTRMTREDTIDGQDQKEIERFHSDLIQNMKDKDAEVASYISDKQFPVPDEEASTIREKLNIKTGSIDVLSVMIKLGIQVRFSSLGQLSGALIRIYKPNTQFGVIVNSDQPDDRVRFSLAHELAHIILGHKSEKSNITSSIKGRRFNPIERDADTFAAELLMPESELINISKKFMEDGLLSELEIFQLSQKFAVSFKAMLVRLSELKIISRSQYNAFSSLKPTEIEKQTLESQSSIKKIAFDKSSIETIANTLRESQFYLNKTTSPEWVRLLQERVWEKYITTIPASERATDVKEVYETVAFWIAENDPI